MVLKHRLLMPYKHSVFNKHGTLRQLEVNLEVPMVRRSSDKMLLDSSSPVDLQPCQWFDSLHLRYSGPFMTVKT